MNCKSVVKSKSMISEELHLNDHLEKIGIEPIETDLGEFIVQLNDEPPYHIVTPAMHKSKEDIADLFNKKLNTPLDFTPEKAHSGSQKGVTGEICECRCRNHRFQLFA
jgi:L-lactate dehydrogenase complex protein LldF